MKQFIVTQELIDYFKENKRLTTWEVGEIIEEHVQNKRHSGVAQTEELTPKEVDMLQRTFSRYIYGQRFQISKKFKETYPNDFQQGKIVVIVGLYDDSVILATPLKAIKYPLPVLLLLI